MKFDASVKEVVVALGLRHKNRAVELRDLGNSIDTLRRVATLSYGVRWARSPSPALMTEMRTAVPVLRPTTQAYASDIDRIEINLRLMDISSRVESHVAENAAIQADISGRSLAAKQDASETSN